MPCFSQLARVAPGVVKNNLGRPVLQGLFYLVEPVRVGDRQDEQVMLAPQQLALCTVQYACRRFASAALCQREAFWVRRSVRRRAEDSPTGSTSELSAITDLLYQASKHTVLSGKVLRLLRSHALSIHSFEA